MSDPLPGMPSRLAQVLGVQVLAVGGYVPERVATNAELQATLDCDADWILQRTGIRERRIAPPGMATSHMAAAAGRLCLERAGVPASEVDLLVVGTFTPDMPVPAAACLVQERLGIRAPAFDVHAACSGFMYALVTGMQFVKTGASCKALVIGADCNSRIVNPRDKRSYPLFGDGAGAVLLGPGAPDQGLVSYTLGTAGSGAELLCIPAGGSLLPMTPELLAQERHFLVMEGRAVFKWAVRVVEQTTHLVLDHAGLRVSDLKLILLHQANVRILEAAITSLGFDPAKVLINLDRLGNTSAGSIPLALEQALAEGRVQRGDLMLLSGFGAGLTWGTGILRW